MDLKRALAEDFTIEKAPYKWSKSVSCHEQSKPALKGQSSRVSLKAGDGTTSSDKSDKDPKVPNKANTSSFQKHHKKKNKNKKDDSTASTTGKKKSKASGKKKSHLSRGTNNNQIADLLLGVLSLLVPSSKGVVRGGTSSNR
ncbi:hypothetical protein RCL_jg16016.t1 [Rhizophagus clarus]|uniref:Uncharacterized protein n=1 Tax=Rhizophagus clarus TaxID=94130 RepID=A0A8H3LAP7_9GLOM|nr:hypothetical protein RCL_jg16016.t1 [Rhizophagus clarus]